MDTIPDKHERVTALTRNTIQRSLVLDAVRSLRSHPTAADVYGVVRDKHPHISRATVYRNLGVLVSRGDVLRIEVPNGADRYDFFNEPHYHAKCRVCGQIFDVDMPYRHDMSAQVAGMEGFDIEGHQIIFSGVCARCQDRDRE